MKLLGVKMVITMAKYQNGNNAMQLLSEEGEPYAVASVNIPTALGKEEICIKNYSENEGILELLIEDDIVEEPHGFYTSGHVEIPVCRLNDKYIPE